jgi:hypothetical protein
MASFCRYCGAHLEDGQVCTCQAQAQQPVTVQDCPAPQAAAPQQQASASQQPYSAPQQAYGVPQQVYVAPAQPAAPSAVSLYLKRFLAFLKFVLKKPATTLRQFTAAADFQVALGVIVINALAFGLFMLSFGGRIQAAIDKVISAFTTALLGLSSITSALGGSSVSSPASNPLSLPLPTYFFLSLVLALLLSLLFAAILLMFNKAVFKANTAYKPMLCVVAANNLATAPFYLVAALVLFVSVPIAVMIALFGVVLSFFFTAAALKGGSSIDDDKAVYTLFLSYAVELVVMGIVIYLVAHMYLPASLNSLANYSSALK